MSGAQQNLRQVGWLYQPPAMNKKNPKVRAPPISSIPGLGVFSQETSDDTNPYLRWYKPTDTPYMILSKEGGRKDLLCFKENVFDKDAPPKPYPRPDWLTWKVERPGESQGETYMPNLPDFMVYDIKPHPIPLLIGARRRQRPCLASDFPLGISIGKYKTMNNIDVPQEKKQTQRIRQGLEAIQKERPDMGKMLSHAYAKEYELIRKEYHKEETEQIAKLAKEEGKYDPYKFRRQGNKGYGGKSKKPKQIVGGW